MRPPDGVGRCAACAFPADQMLYEGGRCIACTLAHERHLDELASVLFAAVPIAAVAEPPAPFVVGVSAEIDPAQRGQVLRLAAIGFSVSDIAHALHVEEEAVRRVTGAAA